MRKSGSLQIGDASGKWFGSTFSPFLLPSATLPPASASSHPRPTDRPRSFLFHYILPHFTSLAGFASTEQRGEKTGGTERGTEERERGRIALAVGWHPRTTQLGSVPVARLFPLPPPPPRIERVTCSIQPRALFRSEKERGPKV